MRYKLLIIGMVLLLFFGNFVDAYPLINNISLQSEDIWLGETEIIFLNCTDDNSTISNVFADITTTTAFFPNNQFKQNSKGLYYLTISTASPSNFNKVGLFEAVMYCINNNTESTNTTISFSVSNLSLELNSITSPLYVKDLAEINTFLKKDGNSITSDITFEMRMDGINTSFESSPYYSYERGWILKFNTEELTIGTHTISLIAQYSGGTVSYEREITILKPVEFSILDIDKTRVFKDEEVIVSIKAVNRGNPITIDESYISLYIGSTPIEILEIYTSSTSGAYDIKFKTPAKAYDKYNLKVVFNYQNNSFEDLKKITYVIPISGTIYSDSDDKHSIQIEFKSNTFEETITTDNNGKYSTSFPTGTYDIKVKDNSNLIEIQDAKITSFDDSIKYQSISLGTVEGIYGKGIYFYAIDSELSYSKITLKINYNQEKISNISSLETYVCRNWNRGIKKCESKWEIIDSTIDTLRKTATVENSIPNAAYIIGNKKTIDFGLSLNKEVYNINEKITITGLSQDNLKNIIPNAVINAAILGTEIKASTTSNSKGIFSFDIDNTKSEGVYTIVVDISKELYTSSQKKINFTVVKSKEMSIVSKDTIRLYPEEQLEVQFLLINTGESDISNTMVSLEGIPSNYYQLITPQKIGLLEVSKEIPISVYFDIPKNASKEILSASFKLSADGISKKQGFVLNILAPKNNTETLQTTSEKSIDNQLTKFSDLMPSFSMPTGLVSFAAVSTEFIPLTLFAIISISSAFFLRKRRIKNAHLSELRKGNRKLILEIRQKMAEPIKIKETPKTLKNKEKKAKKKVPKN